MDFSAAKNKTYLLVSTCVLLLVIIIVLSINVIEKDKETERKHLEQISITYNKGIELLKNKDYEKANMTFYSMKTSTKNNKSAFNYPNFPDINNIYAYSNAMNSYNKKEYRMVGHYLKEIPDTYTGEFADDIKKAKAIDWDKKDAETKKIKAELAQSLADNQGVNIGANKRSVINEWGNPNKINKTETANGIREQWVYDNAYVYFINGEVVNIQQ